MVCQTTGNCDCNDDSWTDRCGNNNEKPRLPNATRINNTLSDEAFLDKPYRSNISDIGSSNAYKANEIIMGISKGASNMASKAMTVLIRLNMNTVLLRGC